MSELALLASNRGGHPKCTEGNAFVQPNSDWKRPISCPNKSIHLSELPTTSELMLEFNHSTGGVWRKSTLPEDFFPRVPHCKAHRQAVQLVQDQLRQPSSRLRRQTQSAGEYR